VRELNKKVNKQLKKNLGVPKIRLIDYSNFKDTNSIFKMATKRKNRRICCVVGCHRREGDKDITFYRFPSKNSDQKSKWLMAIKRINTDGTPWFPTDSSRICSEHFITGKKSCECDSPGYIPTIFPTNHKKPALTSDVERFNRRQKRKASLPDEEYVHVIPTKEEFSSQTEFCSWECTVPLFVFSRESPREASSQCCLPLAQDKSVQTNKCTGQALKSSSCQSKFSPLILNSDSEYRVR